MAAGEGKRLRRRGRGGENGGAGEGIDKTFKARASCQQINIASVQSARFMDET